MATAAICRVLSGADDSRASRHGSRTGLGASCYPPRRHRRVIEGLVAGYVVNQVVVDGETRKWSLIALERMLALP